MPGFLPGLVSRKIPTLKPLTAFYLYAFSVYIPVNAFKRLNLRFFTITSMFTRVTAKTFVFTALKRFLRFRYSGYNGTRGNACRRNR